MHKRLVLVALPLLAGAVWLVATAGSLEPPGPPAPTMKTLAEVEPRIPVSGPAPIVIAAPGSYYLTGNVSATGNAVEIVSDNVTLDLSGYTLRGTLTGYGVLIDGGENVSVTNGNILDFEDGIHALDAHRLRLSSLRSRGNSVSGISITELNSAGTEGAAIEGCHVEGNAIGMAISLTVAPLIVRGNTVTDNLASGISASPRIALIESNIVTLNGAAGIDLSDSAATVRGNLISQNGGAGILLNVGIAGEILDNIVRLNDVGIGLGFEADPSGLVVARNLSAHNLTADYDLAGVTDVAPIAQLPANPGAWANIEAAPNAKARQVGFGKTEAK